MAILDDNVLEPHVCGECGIRWAMPPRFVEGRRNDGKTFYCPNGHARVFRESEADKLRRERDHLKQQLVERDDRINRERECREAAERRASAARGQVARLKNRAAAGVCPCCNRTFSQLARHMADKHPGFAVEAAE
jgi:hypothetical protein